MADTPLSPKLIEETLQEILDMKDEEQLALCEHKYFGRKDGWMTVEMKKIKDLPAEERKEKAKGLNTFKSKILEAIAARREQLSAPDADVLQKETVDFSLNLPKREQGHLHLVHEFIAQVEEVFGRMGFDVMYSTEVESEDLNFTQLNFPVNHPSRDAQDTFWIKGTTGKERKLLRTHTSPGQIRYMRSHKPPFRAVFPGKVYRKDADATHSPMFHQFEGLMIGEHITLANMKAIMVTAIRELISKDAEFRFRTGFFPFVEPGLEVDVRWRSEEQQTKEGTWLEIVGCGMVHPNVLKNCNIDPEKWQGFAFGFGIDRMVMIRHQIPSIRSLFPGDLRFLKQF
ncbi:phenylalanine--tRNA ligase subunit alpha [Candidatus Peregrinibacteria bacterium CG10_big_fil_rev_8_21_14_0_10_49_10]|nr:MAG: phenylalanine--tRNA ligase subunit alpha [Candidatus Peregrinibacteria bacterium CG10_big_fil_rev_8_21_14_0_10_49_10]